MRLSPLAALVGSIGAAALGCGGKIAPLGDAGGATDSAEEEEEVELASPDAGPVVDSVFPRSGPNSGGTRVTVTGSGFVTGGGTQISFAGFPASDVACDSEERCVATSPYAGPSAVPETVDVQATLAGALGAPGSRSSAVGPRDEFTFRAGPPCTQSLACSGLYFPQLIIDCPAAVAFYLYPRTPQQELVATATTFMATTNDVGAAVSACYGDPSSTSCTPFSTFEAQLSYCGDPNFCFDCERWLMGVCIEDLHGNTACRR
jgi:hypothetical protein